MLRASAQWLVCKDVCIPENGEFELRLPVVAAGTQPGSTATSAMFERAAGLRSVPLQGWTADLQQHGRDLLLTLQADGSQPLPAVLPDLQVFPYAEQVIDPALHELYRTPRGYALKMKLMADAKLPARWTVSRWRNRAAARLSASPALRSSSAPRGARWRSSAGPKARSPSPASLPRSAAKAASRAPGCWPRWCWPSPAACC